MDRHEEAADRLIVTDTAERGVKEIRFGEDGRTVRVRVAPAQFLEGSSRQPQVVRTAPPQFLIQSEPVCEVAVRSPLSSALSAIAGLFRVR